MTSSPPLPPASPKDVEQLRLLATFHYVLGGLGCLLSCLPLIHVVLGLVMANSPASLGGGSADAPPPFFGYLLAGFGLLLVLLGWTLSLLTLFSGRCLARRRRRVFSIVVGALLTLLFPFGTVLGVFTIIVLNRDAIRQLYGDPA